MTSYPLLPKSYISKYKDNLTLDGKEGGAEASESIQGNPSELVEDVPEITINTTVGFSERPESSRTEHSISQHMLVQNIIDKYRSND